MEDSLRTYHPETATSLSRLAKIHMDQREPEKALSHLERAVEINEGAFGDTSNEEGGTLLEIGDAKMLAGDYGEAERYLGS